MSNQWLNKGIGLRNRGYNPVSVSVTVEAPSDSWSRVRGIAVEVTAMKGNHEYQTVHFTQEEADNLGQTLLLSMSKRAREKVLLHLLKELSHAKILRALALDLRKRFRLPPEA